MTRVIVSISAFNIQFRNNINMSFRSHQNNHYNNSSFSVIIKKYHLKHNIQLQN